MGDFTKKYILAYFDILGYKDIVLNNRISEEKFIGIIGSMIDAIIRSKDFYPKIKVKTYFFSDNCLICYEKMDSVEYVFEIRLIFFIIQIIQKSLFCNFGVSIRGAILEGDLYLTDNFIYGKGIIEAYNIENNIAIYPRIIISKELLNNIFFEIKNIFLEEKYKYGKKLFIENMFELFNDWEASILPEDFIIPKWGSVYLRKDFDGLYYIDFLSSTKVVEKNIDNIFRKYKEQIVIGLRKNRGNINVINKFLWYITYGNHFFEKCLHKEILNKREIEKIIGCKIKVIRGKLTVK